MDGGTEAFAPRRIVLDDLLVRAGAEAGAELREAFTVDEVLVEDGVVTGIRGHAKRGAPVTERARVVIGADGKHSLVAKAVRPEHYNEVLQLQTGYYAYEANRKDYEGNYLPMLELVPEFAERLRAATRETRLATVGDLRGFFRKPFGPGWALVGDAGYHKDPITAFGITDAFRDAEAASAALDDAFAGRQAYDVAMATWQQARDEESLALLAGRAVHCRTRVTGASPPGAHPAAG